MIQNDQQLGIPGTAYRGTKTDIEAAFNLPGMTAYATDTGEWGYRDGSGWVWGSGGGAGDMLKSVYDTDDDGIVNAADTATYSATAGDADTLDGYHAVDFAFAGHTHAQLHDALTLDASATALLSVTGQNLSVDVQNSNLFFVGPASGAAAVPTFRSVVNADLAASAGVGSILYAGASAPTWSSVANLMWDNTNKWLGIGMTPTSELSVYGTGRFGDPAITTVPEAKLSVSVDVSSIASVVYAFSANAKHSPTANSNKQVSNFLIVGVTSATPAVVHSSAVNNQLNANVLGSISTSAAVTACLATALHASTGTSAQIRGVYGRVGGSGTYGTIATAYGVLAKIETGTSGTITTGYGVYVANIGGTGTITNLAAIVTAAGAGNTLLGTLTDVSGIRLNVMGGATWSAEGFKTDENGGLLFYDAVGGTFAGGLLYTATDNIRIEHNGYGCLYCNTTGNVQIGDGSLFTGMTAGGSLGITQDLKHAGSKLGVFNTAPTTKRTVTGSRGSNAALASLLTALAAYGLITDSSS